VSRFLLDEMFPPDAARLLREQSDHDAVHVSEVGLRGADDAAVASLARAEDRVLVTENVAHFTAERDLVLVFVLKKSLPAGGGQAKGLTVLLNRWTNTHPDPYRGHHWPT
jgi:hypothetical protein